MADESTSAPAFQLSPREDWIFGVGFEKGRLRFGPAGGELLLWGIAALIAIVLGALFVSAGDGATLNGYEVRNPEVMVLTGVVFSGLACAHFVARLTSGVRADHAGIELRYWFRRQRYSWAEIHAVRVVELKHGRMGVYVGPNSVDTMWRPVSAWSIGVIDIEDGSIRELPGFRSGARSEGMSLGMETTTEVKVAALRRFREAVADPWPDVDDAHASNVLSQPRHTRSLVVSLLGLIGVWLLVSWAAGRLVSAVVPIAAAAFVMGRYFVLRDSSRPHEWPTERPPQREGPTHYLR